jgi:type I restriction enzyme, R subunit
VRSARRGSIPSWRGNKFKEKEVRNAIRKHLSDDGLIELIFDLVRNQHEY